MKFNRLELINQLRIGIEQRQEKRAAEYLIKVNDWSTEQAVWTTRYGADWRELMNTIRRRLSKGQPVTREDIPQPLLDDSWGGKVTLRGVGALKPPPEPGALSDRDMTAVELVRLLSASEDEFVTTAAIEAMGIKLSRLL